MVLVSSSILSADFMRLGDTVSALRAAGVDMLHIDVMDGVFVPNISIGLPVLRSIREGTDLTLDVHLMIDRPHRFVRQFAEAGANIIGIHYEAGSPVRETLREIAALGCAPCLTIKPNTPVEEVFGLLEDCRMVLIMSVEPGFGGQKFLPETLSKITALRREADRQGISLDIEVDGGIDLTTAPQATAAGANVLVVGSALIGAKDKAGVVAAMKAT